MDITLSEYITNPMGKSNAVVPNKEMIRAIYLAKFRNVMLRENGKLDFTLYKGKDDTYVVHCKVPSSSVKEFYYDVVFYFYLNSGKVARSLEDYNVKFFSNDPAFVYTFAHAFIENGIFFDDLKPKLSREAIKQTAKEKNPKNDLGYVKTFYFAYLGMKEKGLFNKTRFVSAEKYSKTKLLHNVAHTDEKIATRISEGEKQKRLAKENKKTKFVGDKNVGSKPLNGKSDLKTRNSTITSKVGSTNKTKSTSHVKRK